MKRHIYLVAAVGLLAAALGCSDKSPSPAAPSSAPVAADDTSAAADGSTLKVPAPVQTAPANGAALEQFETTLRVNSVTALYTTATQFAYRFQLLLNGQVVREFRTSAFTEWKVNDLDVNLTYGWRARAEQGQAFGPWSPTWTFKTPDIPQGYIAGGEVYDPLWNGKTVGTINGPTRFVPDVGIQMLDFSSNVEYALGQSLTAGEISLLVTNAPAQTDGVKTKIMSMREGRSDITTNRRRFTIEKRGGHVPGQIGWRIITNVEEVSAVGPERVSRNFMADRTYLWTARWGNGVFNLQIREGGASGPVIYNFGKGYSGVYDPDPHMAYIGAPVGRGGPGDATVPGMIVRQLWISSRPRPEFANK